MGDASSPAERCLPVAERVPGKAEPGLKIRIASGNEPIRFSPKQPVEAGVRRLGKPPLSLLRETAAGDHHAVQRIAAVGYKAAARVDRRRLGAIVSRKHDGRN